MRYPTLYVRMWLTIDLTPKRCHRLHEVQRQFRTSGMSSPCSLT
jgi:hypothetical protein